jgi:cytochrome c-type biogenesis protein CcmH/NrfG
MIGAVLLLSGLFAVVYGSWRGYLAARAALLPFVRQGDETRALVEAAQPVHERARLRLAVRNAGLSMIWLGMAMYGLYLATVGIAVRA